MRAFLLSFLLSALPMGLFAKDDNDIPFEACAPLGAYYPPPTIDKTSEPFKKLIAELTKSFDDLIENGGSDKYGPISVNTTSFSVAIFGGGEHLRNDPVFFEYHYTSPQDQASNANITLDTRFPVGDVSMVFTVYAWLANMGEQWETPVTKYLPELAQVNASSIVSWKDVTIGALAGHMSGLSRESGACVVGKRCDFKAFLNAFAEKTPYFLPDTTPVVSYGAYQLLAFAMQRRNGNEKEWATLLEETLLKPLNMTDSGVLGSDTNDIFAMESLNTSLIGEPGALSFVSSARDLARAGHSMLASDLLSPAITRRWLHSDKDTSNLRNGVGKPWEVYRAGNAISPIIDASTKSGAIGKYASYYGLTTDFNAGFAILAHDSSVKDRKLDLNVHADIVSEVLGYLRVIAAKELEARYAGFYKAGNDDAAFNTTDNGSGLEVQKLGVDKVDIKKKTAEKLGIKSKDLDFRIYPTNVRDENRHQFIAAFQNKAAPIDAGTPTCITWQEIGAAVEISVVFTLNDGEVVGVEIPQLEVKMERIG